MKTRSELIAEVLKHPSTENIAAVNNEFGYRIFKEPTKIPSSVLIPKSENLLFIIANVNDIPNIEKFLKLNDSTFYFIRNNSNIFSSDLKTEFSNLSELFGCSITQLTLSEFIDFYNCSESISETLCVSVRLKFKKSLLSPLTMLKIYNQI